MKLLFLLLKKPTKITTPHQTEPRTEFCIHDFTTERSWVCSQIPRKFILLSFHQTCSASDSNSSCLNDFEQFYDFFNVLFCQYFTRTLTDGCTKGRRECWLLNKLAPALQFYLALLIISLILNSTVIRTHMACLDKCKDLDVVLLAGLTAKSAPRTSPAHQGSLRQQLPYLRYCCEQPNCCLLLTQAPSTRIYSLSFTATLLSWLHLRCHLTNCFQLDNTDQRNGTVLFQAGGCFLL